MIDAILFNHGWKAGARKDTCVAVFIGVWSRNLTLFFLYKHDPRTVDAYFRQ